jgi:hypothetical protein
MPCRCAVCHAEVGIGQSYTLISPRGDLSICGRCHRAPIAPRPKKLKPKEPPPLPPSTPRMLRPVVVGIH